MADWYVLRTAPQKEFVAQLLLERKGMRVYLPTEIKWRRMNRYSKRKTAHVYPLFVRYLFVEQPPSWDAVFRTNVVSGVVGIAGTPTPIPAADLEKVKKMSGTSIPHRTSQNPHKSFRPGDLVEITHGACVGAIVKIEGLHGQKARIMMDILGSKRLVDVPLSALEAA